MSAMRRSVLIRLGARSSMIGGANGQCASLSPADTTAIAEGKIDTTFLISHRMPLEAGPEGYQKFHDEQDTYTKIVLKPGMSETSLAA